MFHKILVGYDGSKGGTDALRRAAAIARDYEAQITALWVRGPLPRHSDLPGEFEAEKEVADEFFADCQNKVRKVSADHHITICCESRSGHPAKALVKHAHEGAYDLIVVGHSTRCGLWGRLLGDTADRIADDAHCSVLVVKASKYDHLI